MIEPPGDFGRTGVLEIHDGIFVAVELILVEQGSGTVDQAGEFELGVAADALAERADRALAGMGHRRVTFDYLNSAEPLRAGERPASASVTADGRRFEVRVRIDTPMELEYFRHGGILQYVLRALAAGAA